MKKGFPTNFLPITLAALLALSALACSFPFIAQNQSEASTPPRQVEFTESDLESFNTKWRGLVLATPDGPFSVTFTEAELNAAMQQAITRARADGREIPISSAQLVLAEGQIQVYAQVALGPIQPTGVIRIAPSIAPDGSIDVTIVSVDFGMIEFDTAVLDELVTMLERSINDPIQASPVDVRIETISLTEGELTVGGTLTP
ncbi:MAG: hypothetical protein Kow00124_23270 [Anaerolineae bacterium]